MRNDIPDITSMSWCTAAYPASAPDYPYEQIGECEECGNAIEDRDEYIESDHLLFCCEECQERHFENLEEDEDGTSSFG